MDEPDRHPVFSRRLTSRELLALDAAGAVAYALLLGSIVASHAGRAAAPGPPLWARCLVMAAIALPLAARRRWPVAVFGVVLAASLVGLAAGMPGDSFVGAGLALYVVALTRPRRRWEPTLAIGLLSAAAALGAAVAGSPVAAWSAAPVAGAVLGGAWTIGRAVAERRAYAVRSAAQLAGQAVAEERLRIARELHDVVAHSLGLIAVKAGVANHVLAARPEEAHDALRVIEATSRSALSEMRDLLGVLRTGPGQAPGRREAGAEASLAPTPGVADLRGLADRAAQAGVRVDMELRGLDRVPEGMGQSVYRIVQEALTNVVRHAAPAQCHVLVAADDRAIEIEVTDDGPGRRTLPEIAGPGHGLAGMRERVAVYGGAFSAGPRPEGGFAVSVRLPRAAAEEAS